MAWALRVWATGVPLPLERLHRRAARAIARRHRAPLFPPRSDDMWLAAFGLHHGNVLDYFVSGAHWIGGCWVLD